MWIVRQSFSKRREADGDVLKKWTSPVDGRNPCINPSFRKKEGRGRKKGGKTGDRLSSVCYLHTRWIKVRYCLWSREERKKKKAPIPFPIRPGIEGKDLEGARICEEGGGNSAIRTHQRLHRRPGGYQLSAGEKRTLVRVGSSLQATSRGKERRRPPRTRLVDIIAGGGDHVPSD